MRRRQLWWWVDRRTRVVVRGKRAVQLGVVQFAVFDALHSRRAERGKKLCGDAVADAVYRGVASPGCRNTIHATVHATNKKLAWLDLKIQGVNRKQNSFYELKDLL